MNELAAFVAAETASSSLDYVLLKDMNQLTQKRYADMVNLIKGLQPQMEVRWSPDCCICICRATAAVLCQIGYVCFTSYNLTAAFSAFSQIALLSSRLSLHTMSTVKHFR